MAGGSEVPTPISPCEKSSIGVCYGMNGSNLPAHSDVVKLYQAKGIGAMRLYEPNCDTLEALKDTGIKVMMGVDNAMLKSLGKKPNVAVDWVQKNIVHYAPKVSFRYIVVGNEVPHGDFDDILPAMKNVWDAIKNEGLHGTIKISTSVKYDVIANSTDFPSKAEFNPSYNMAPIVKFLAETENPLSVNIYPYLSYEPNHNTIREDYALFTAGSAVVQDPGHYQYQNLFDAMVDAVYYALEKAGGPEVGVVVSESGWPSAGERHATVKNAQTYNQNLINHVGIGTPKKNEYLDTYIYAMFNEDEKVGPAFSRHFGLFFPDETPVYPIIFK